MELTDFINQRLDEDEALARDVEQRVASGRWYEDAEGSSASAYFDRDYSQGGYTITAARALAEVEAKRRIVAEWVREEGANFGDEFLNGVCTGLERAVRLLALPYATHPDYREEEWRP